MAGLPLQITMDGMIILSLLGGEDDREKWHTACVPLIHPTKKFFK